jgi:hypothetical protein
LRADADRGGELRPTWVVMLIVGMLWLCPLPGAAGTTGEQRPEQKQLFSQGTLKVLQKRLTAEGVYAEPVDGVLNAQTEAADEATLKQL